MMPGAGTLQSSAFQQRRYGTCLGLTSHPLDISCRSIKQGKNHEYVKCPNLKKNSCHSFQEKDSIVGEFCTVWMYIDQGMTNLHMCLSVSASSREHITPLCSSTQFYTHPYSSLQQSYWISWLRSDKTFTVHTWNLESAAVRSVMGAIKSLYPLPSPPSSSPPYPTPYSHPFLHSEPIQAIMLPKYPGAKNSLLWSHTDCPN